jgi:L-amino acid N-acyltransferase YncA
MPSIRLANERDAAAIAEIYAPIVTNTAISFEIEAPTPETIAKRITNTLPTYPWLVSEDSSAVVGYAYASQHRKREAYQWSVDVSVYIHENWRGQGIGRMLYTTLFSLLRAQGFINVCAGIALPNPGSVTLHEAMGMTPVGIYRGVGYKLGAWHDVGWWEGVLQLPLNPPAPPRPLTALVTTPEWREFLLDLATSDQANGPTSPPRATI